MKVSDIESAFKRLGAIPLKEARPETYQAELSAGPSTVFLSRPSLTPEEQAPDMTTKQKLQGKTRRNILSERVAGPEERLFGGKGILVRYKPSPTADSPEKSGMPTAESRQTSQPATGADSASTPASNLPPIPDLNLPPEDPTVKDAIARREAWLKGHPPEPISPEVEQLVRDLM
jgi:hypothetical protein